MTEYAMFEWHHRLSGYEFAQIQGDSEGQGRLSRCSAWGSQRVEHDWVMNINNIVYSIA